MCTIIDYAYELLGMPANLSTSVSASYGFLMILRLC